MNNKTNRDWRDWLADLLSLDPEDRADLLELLERLRQKGDFLSGGEMRMIEGVLRMRDRKVRDVMIPRNDIIGLRTTDGYAAAVRAVCESQHSRYPVFDDSGETVAGILLAKDLLGYVNRPDEFAITKVMRAPAQEPEHKPLDVLLDDFRETRSHMVIVFDEHSQTAGIVTIEDVLEQIVGDINDESDDDKEDGHLTPEPQGGGHIVKGALSLRRFNDHFQSDLPTSAADDIASWLAAEFGRIPKNGERLSRLGFAFQIAEADERRVYKIWVKAEQPQ